jgi:hypothetical protein
VVDVKAELRPNTITAKPRTTAASEDEKMKGRVESYLHKAAMRMRETNAMGGVGRGE